MKSTIVKVCLRGMLIIGGGAIVAAVLMALAFMVPVNSKIADNALEVFDKEGWYPLASVQSQEFATYFHSYEPDVLDNGTDRVMISTALDQVLAESAIYRAMSGYSAYYGDNYSYYWHGYSIILRPLMYLFSFTDFRNINSALQILLVFLLIKIVWDKKGALYALAIFSIYLLAQPVALGKSLQFSWIFYIALLGSYIAVKYSERLEKDYKYLYLFLIIGMMTSFFDLLTYPLFTWGMVAVIFILMDKDGASPWVYLWKVVSTGIAWIMGYAGMWCMKWFIGSLVLGENIFEKAIWEVMYRAGTQGDNHIGVLTWSDRLETLYINWKHYDNMFCATILLLWLIGIFVLNIKNGVKKSEKTLSLTVTGVSSFVWYLVVANHTITHHFFTYRIWLVSMLAFMIIGLINYDGNVLLEYKKRLQVIGKWLVCGMFSVVLVFLFAKEGIDVSNTGLSPRYVSLGSGNKWEVEFTPTFSGIHGFLLCMKSESTSGYYQITLSKGGALLYQEKYDIAEFSENSYGNFEVEWDVKAGVKYELMLEAVEPNAEVFAVITEEGSQPLAEYQNLRINGKAYNSQPSTGFTYWSLPPSRCTQILLVGCTMACLISVVLSLESVLHRKANIKVKKI